MPYSEQTEFYRIPYLQDGDKLNGESERIITQTIENQIRAGILGAGANRVFREGTYEVEVDSTNISTVTLSGEPSLQGICNSGLVESYDPIVWTGLEPNKTYKLYILADQQTFIDPDQFTTIASEIEITADNHLYLAEVDTTDATPSNSPTIDTNPDGKPTAFNLFELLNTNTDPFGPILTQTAITILDQLTVFLGTNKTALFKQTNSAATAPVISIENASEQPELRSSGELRFADIRVLDGFALSDDANPAYIGAAVSIIGALNEILNSLNTHIADSDDPHGEVLTQTTLILRNFIKLPKIILTCPPPTPPGPPGSPPGPPPSPPGIDDLECNVTAECEMVFCDDDGLGAKVSLSDVLNRNFLGESTSLIGSLNELYQSIQDLFDLVNGLVGSTLLAQSPVNILISPDDVGANLHFKIVFSEADNLSPVTKTVESIEDNTGWYYEYHPPLPASPPATHTSGEPLPPLTIVNPLPPEWRPLPSTGLSETLQVKLNGDPVQVQYRPQEADLLYSRRRYAVLVSQYNFEYGEAQLGSLVMG